MTSVILKEASPQCSLLRGNLKLPANLYERLLCTIHTRSKTIDYSPILNTKTPASGYRFPVNDCHGIRFPYCVCHISLLPWCINTCEWLLWYQAVQRVPSEFSFRSHNFAVEFLKFRSMFGQCVQLTHIAHTCWATPLVCISKSSVRFDSGVRLVDTAAVFISPMGWQNVWSYIAIAGWSA